MVYYYTGMHTGTFWLSLIAFILVSSFYGLLLPYASICIGQLWQKHRLAGSFLTYFLINILTQIIRTIYVGLTGNEDADHTCTELYSDSNLWFYYGVKFGA